MRLVPILLTVFALLSPAAPAQEAHRKSALDKVAFEAYIRQVELLPATVKVIIGDPKPTPFDQFLETRVDIVTPQGSFLWRYFVSKDGRLVIKGSVFDMAKNPFQIEQAKLKTDLKPSMGTPGAPVVMVLFSDFQCPRCQEEAKALRDNLLKKFPDKVRLYFTDYPLAQLHPWAHAAAIAGRCVFREKPAAFWGYHDWIYEHQPEITVDNLKTKVIGWAETANLDTAKLGQCIDTKATEKEVEREIEEGHSLAINGTPALYINGRPLGGAIPWATLEQVINLEIGYQKLAADSGEKCCEVTIPSLVPAQK